MTPLRRRTRSQTVVPSIGIGLAVAAASAVAAPAPADAAAERAPNLAVARVVPLPGVAAPRTAALAPTTPAHLPQAAERTHVVVAGDTVSAIARRHGTTVAAVVAANRLDARAFIRVGQVLVIPGQAAAAAPAAPRPAGAARRHVVVAGDTVSAIARRHGTTVAAVVAANRLDARAFIRTGQTLVIPAAGAVPAPAAAPAAPSGSPAGSVSHVVVAGDTVSGLAARFGSSTARIVAANGLGSRALIRVGQRLTIPTGTAPAVAPLPSTFAGRTYPSATVAAATANRDALLARAVPSRAETQRLVRATAVAMGVDPALAQAVAFQESGFNQRAVSPANAIGTMQVIPSSGAWASQLVGRPLDLLDTRDNVTAGVAILRQLRRMEPDFDTAVAGYYQGLGSVRRNGMYADTRRYVASVRQHMTRFG